MTQPAKGSHSAMEALYPFLYADTSDLSGVLAQLGDLFGLGHR